MSLRVDDKAPDFVLPDQAGKKHTLVSLKGSWVLLYFYPKDDTPGCTKEACGIRDLFPRFEKLGTAVYGVSIDSVQSHKKFAEKYNLPFPLLADEGKEVVKLYAVWQKKKFAGREYMGTVRTSFLIDPYGKIAKIYKTVKPETHAEEVLEYLKGLHLGKKSQKKL